MQRYCIRAHRAATGSDVKNMVQVGMDMRPDRPFAGSRAVDEGFDVNEPLIDRTARLTIQIEGGNAAGHAAS
jgi:hypothetical protein